MSFRFPLATTSWGKEEIDAMQRVIASGSFTMGANVQVFEHDFEDNNVTKNEATIEINNPDFAVDKIITPGTAGSGKTINYPGQKYPCTGSQWQF